MHMADALLSPAVGGTMWLLSGAAIARCCSRVQAEADSVKTPLMGVLGAFVFAAHLFTFAIPGTGSSGHLCGGILLALILGPHAAFLTLASVLVVQALFFGDGGLLALGCNIFNMAFVNSFLVYPLLFRPIPRVALSRNRMGTAVMLAAVISLQLGALCVALETWLSGLSELPLSAFMLLMQPIHLAMGVVEGFITSAVVTFVEQAQPDILGNGMLADDGAAENTAEP